MNRNQLGWKSVLVGSAMAFGSNITSANEVLPDNVSLIQSETKEKVWEHLEHDSSDTTSELSKNIAVGATVFGIAAGGLIGSRRLLRSKQKNDLKNQIKDLNKRYETEKARYPQWYLFPLIELYLARLNGHTEEDLAKILSLPHWEATFQKDIAEVTDFLNTMATEWQENEEKRTKKLYEADRLMSEVRTLESSLQRIGFQFRQIQAFVTESPVDVNDLDFIVANIRAHHVRLSDFERFYRMMDVFDTRIQSTFDSKKSELSKISVKHRTLYKKENRFDLAGLQNEIHKLSYDFRTIYRLWDIDALEALHTAEKVLFAEMDAHADVLKKEIDWLKSLTSQIADRERNLWGIQIKSQYTENATTYAKKTGDMRFVLFHLPSTLFALEWALLHIKELHAKKGNFAEIEEELVKFDTEFNKVQEFILLGRVLKDILATETQAKDLADKENQDRQNRQKHESGKVIKNSAEEEMRLINQANEIYFWNTESRE